MQYNVNMLDFLSFNCVLLFYFSYYDTKAVFLALGITAVVCIAVTVFCFQTKVWCGWVYALVLISFKHPQYINIPVGGFSVRQVDFTKCQGLFCVLGIVIFVTGIITAIVLSFKYVSKSLCKQNIVSWKHTASSCRHCNDGLLLQILWLHMLYAALGAIVFTMVGICGNYAACCNCFNNPSLKLEACMTPLIFSVFCSS